MSDNRPIKEILEQGHGFTVEKCPRYSMNRAMMKNGSAHGCVNASDAVNFIKTGLMLPCMCSLRNVEDAA